MARKPREKSKTGIYHIMLRGVNKQTIFHDDNDAIRFLEMLKRYKIQTNFELYAYCLMKNHVHILIKEGNEEIGLTMKRIGVSYVYWYNLKYERTGHLFQDRYKSEPVENDQYLFTVLRYIHQNPLKAKLVKDLQEYKWSSYNEYIVKSTIIDSNYILKLFNKDNEKAHSLFKSFHKKIGQERCLELNETRRISDNEALKIIKSILKVENIEENQKMDNEHRDKFIEILKEKGLSSRQIARLTGISRYLVSKE